ncbi:MAG TPA: hypothetical protein VGG87_05245, partial [Solirubrobacteraceae bacterium]
KSAVVAAAPPDSRKNAEVSSAVSPPGELRRGRFGHRDSDQRQGLTYAGEEKFTRAPGRRGAD